MGSYDRDKLRNTDAYKSIYNSISGENRPKSDGDYVVCPICRKRLYRTTYCKDCDSYANV